MEALSRKTEKEKLVELEQMLADATTLTDDASSVSYGSDLQTPTKFHSTPHQDPATSSPAVWSRSGISCSVDTMRPLARPSATDDSYFQEANVTARIFSSSSSGGESSAEEAVVRRHQQELHHRASRRHRRHIVDKKEATEVALLRSELEATRSQVEQKEVVVRSLPTSARPGEIEAQTQARVEEELVAALAKSSGLKEELARTSQLLVDGALSRQHLEQRCSLLTQDLQKSVTRTAELEDEVSISRAELVRISGELHARRGTDVVDAERAFGEELQRVQETAIREARSLKQEVSGLRASLEQTRAKLQKSCGERDSWREEAEALSSEAESLRETVHALRQYSENDTIDELLGQVSRWKRRAEELEKLERVAASSPERSAFSSSSSTPETEASHCTKSADSPWTESGELPPSHDQTKAPERREEKQRGLEEKVEEVTASALQQELSEAKETLGMMEEEVATAVSAAREQAVKRIAAESRVKSLQREAEATAQAAREAVVARRAAKARDVTKFKMAIRQDMADEMYKLQFEMREQTLEKKLHTTNRATQCTYRGGCDREPIGEDKACQADGTMVRSPDEGGLVVLGDTLSRVCAPCPACGGDSAESNPVSVLASPAKTAVLEEEAEKRISAAMASAAAARAGASAWASAFSAARDVFQAALISLCEQATGGQVTGGQVTGGLGAAEGEREQAFMVPLLTGVGDSGSSKANSSAVVPWVPGDAKSEAATALEALRDSVQSATEEILSAAGRTARRVSPPPPPILTTTGSQTLPEPPAPVAPMVSQTEEVPYGDARGARLHHISVQTGRSDGLDFGGASGASGAGGAPAWEGDLDGRCCEAGNGGADLDRRRQREDKERMEKLERAVGALNEALQRAETEKGDLKLMLSVEREEASQVKRQRDMFEADIGYLHASTMALVKDFSGGDSGFRVTKGPLVHCRSYA